MLQLLPKLTKLDNDDVSIKERPSSEQATAAAQPKTEMPSATLVPSPSNNKASLQLPVEPSAMLGQVHKAAELQAALGVRVLLALTPLSSLHLLILPAISCRKGLSPQQPAKQAMHQVQCQAQCHLQACPVHQQASTGAMP